MGVLLPQNISLIGYLVPGTVIAVPGMFLSFECFAALIASKHDLLLSVNMLANGVAGGRAMVTTDERDGHVCWRLQKMLDLSEDRAHLRLGQSISFLFRCLQYV